MHGEDLLTKIEGEQNDIPPQERMCLQQLRHPWVPPGQVVVPLQGVHEVIL
jgi:hypothetical protein